MSGHGAEPKIGEPSKVWLPGETPWAKCLAIHADGSWDGEIVNKLFHELSDIERARFMSDKFGTVKNVPRLHDYRQGQVVRFELEVTPDCSLWVPRKAENGA